MTSERGLRAEVLAALAETHAADALAARLLARRDDRARHSGAGGNPQRHGQRELDPAPLFRRRHAGGQSSAATRSKTTSAVVYHAAIVGAWSRQPYILSVSYGTDVQKGDIRSRGRADEYVRRGIFLVRLTVAPRLSRAFRPRDEARSASDPPQGSNRMKALLAIASVCLCGASVALAQEPRRATRSRCRPRRPRRPRAPPMR